MYGGWWSSWFPTSTHRSVGGDGRQPCRVAGLAAGGARRDGRSSTEFASAARSSSSILVRTATAARADEWLPITPGYRRRAVAGRHAHRCSTRIWCRSAAVAPYLDGRGARCARWPRTGPLSASPRSPASPPTRIRELAREPAAPNAPSVYGPNWLCNQEFGSLARLASVDVAQHPHRPLRHPQRLDVPARRRVVGHRAAVRWSSRTGRRVRPVPHPGARREGGAWGRCRCRAWPRRSRRRGRPDQGADHRRGQPGAVHARRATRSTRCCRRWTR